MALAAQGKITGWRRLLLALLMIGGLMALPIRPEAQSQSQSYSFSSVQVTGNQYVDSATVLAFAKIPQGLSLTSANLNDIYQRIADSGLFETVELIPSADVLTIKVTEFPILNQVEIQGNKVVKDEDLRPLLQSQSARVYSPALAEADAALIATYYFQSGRQAASVRPVIIRRDDNRVDLVFEVTEGKVSELERVNFVGNQSFSDYRLRQLLVTRQAGIFRQITQRDTLDPARLDADKTALTEFYNSRGFLDFRVLDISAVESRERDAAFLTFTISEGQSFRVGNVSTVSTIPGLDPADFDRQRRLRPGVLFDPGVIENNVARMETYALKRGINFVTVEPVLTRHEETGLVDVAFTLKPGERLFIERIDIEGNTTTLDQVIRRQFDTVEGDPFNPREIRVANDRIQALGFFSAVDVSGEPGSQGDQVVLKVAVTEQPTGSISLGATYGVADGFGLNIGYSETNFLGRGQELSLSIQTGTDSIDSHFNFTEPALLGRDLAFSLNTGYLRTNYQYGDYDTEEINFIPGIDFPISLTSRFGLFYRADWVELSNVAGPVFDDTTTPPTQTSNGSSVILINEQGQQFQSGLGYNFGYDSRRSGLDPDRVFLASFGQEFVGLGGDATYVETTAYGLAQYDVPHSDVVLRTTLNGGLLQGFDGYGTMVVNRYFANGKIRGFAPNGIGPRDLTASNQDALAGNIYVSAQFDAEFPLGLPESYGIKGGAFLDVGSVWALDDIQGTSGPVDDALYPRAAIGVSILWATPVGPLRFNFSRALVKQDYDEVQNFDLTISTQF
jgi:outer membrane protein insertion porin family